jgi:hypothetical protein
MEPSSQILSRDLNGLPQTTATAFGSLLSLERIDEFAVIRCRAAILPFRLWSLLVNPIVFITCLERHGIDVTISGFEEPGATARAGCGSGHHCRRSPRCAAYRVVARTALRNPVGWLQAMAGQNRTARGQRGGRTGSCGVPCNRARGRANLATPHGPVINRLPRLRMKSLRSKARSRPRAASSSICPQWSRCDVAARRLEALLPAQCHFVFEQEAEPSACPGGAPRRLVRVP